jgi:hypothetical protein
LEIKSRMFAIDLLSDSSFISGAVFIILIVAIFVLGFMGEQYYSRQSFAALSSVLGAAAGFFFGTKKS